MKNKLTDLNDHLFTALERLNEEGLSDERIQSEVKRAKAVADVGKTVIDNGRLMLEATAMRNEFKDSGAVMPALLGGSQDAQG